MATKKMPSKKSHEEELDYIIHELDKKYPRHIERVNWPARIIGLFLLGCMTLLIAAITYKVFIWAFGVGR